MSLDKKLKFRETLWGHVCRFWLRVLAKWYALADLILCGTANFLLQGRGIVIPQWIIGAVAPLGLIVAGFFVWREDRLGVAEARDKERVSLQEESDKLAAGHKSERRAAAQRLRSSRSVSRLELTMARSENERLRREIDNTVLKLSDRQKDVARVEAEKLQLKESKPLTQLEKRNSVDELVREGGDILSWLQSRKVDQIPGYERWQNTVESFVLKQLRTQEFDKYSDNSNMFLADIAGNQLKNFSKTSEEVLEDAASNIAVQNIVITLCRLKKLRGKITD